MNTYMNDASMISLSQLEAFLKGVEGAVTFNPETGGYPNKQKMYDWVALVLARFKYQSLIKKERGLVLSYIQKVTRLSRIQIKRLVQKKQRYGRLRVHTEGRHTFPIWYTQIDQFLNLKGLHSSLETMLARLQETNTMVDL